MYRYVCVLVIINCLLYVLYIFKYICINFKLINYYRIIVYIVYCYGVVILFFSINILFN